MNKEEDYLFREGCNEEKMSILILMDKKDE